MQHNERTKPTTLGLWLIIPTAAEVEKYGEPAYDANDDRVAKIVGHVETESGAIATAIVKSAANQSGKKAWRPSPPK
jgi:hypothetical protein